MDMSNAGLNITKMIFHQTALRHFINLGMYRIWLSASVAWILISSMAILPSHVIERHTKILVSLDDCVYELGEYATERKFGIDFDFDRTLEDEVLHHKETVAKKELCKEVVALRPAKHTTKYLFYQSALTFGLFIIPIIFAYLLLGFLPRHAPTLTTRYVNWIREGFAELDDKQK